MAIWAYAATAGAGLAAGLAAALLLRLRKRTPSTLQLRPELHGARTLEEAVARMLAEVARWVPGQAYHAYWLDAEGNLLHLRASMDQAGSPHVSPDPSGLVADDLPLAPLSLPAGDRALGPALTGNRAERWLEIPLGRELLVRVLLKYGQQVPPARLAQLRQAGEDHAPFVAAVYQWFRAREEGQRVQSLVDSTRIALDTALKSDRAIQLLLRVGAQVVAADAACVVLAGTGQLRCLSDSPTAQMMGERLVRGEASELLAIPDAPDMVRAPEMGAFGQQFAACARAPVFLDGSPVGCFFYFLHDPQGLGDYQVAGLKALGERAAALLASQSQLESLSQSYTETLRSLVAAMDRLGPHSVGHSDRLARLARQTARELGLGAAEVEAVGLAACLHDVGMVAIDPSLVLKPNRLTAQEYDQLRIHAELGAQLVAPLETALPLGPMIAAHHERWDGHGYPRGLRGEEIPLGARIIACCDLYDAKTSGRSYRAPLDKSRALEQLKAAAGSHLDPRVVAAFIMAMEARAPEAV